MDIFLSKNLRYSNQHWNEISIKIFGQSWRVYIIYTNIMFMKLVGFDKLILNIKFIHI
jgi:hypothetical protein